MFFPENAVRIDVESRANRVRKFLPPKRSNPHRLRGCRNHRIELERIVVRIVKVQDSGRQRGAGAETTARTEGAQIACGADKNERDPAGHFG